MERIRQEWEHAGLLVRGLGILWSINLIIMILALGLELLGLVPLTVAAASLTTAFLLHGLLLLANSDIPVRWRPGTEFYRLTLGGILIFFSIVTLQSLIHG